MHCWCAWLLARTPPAKIATSLHLGSSCHWMHPITQAPSSPMQAHPSQIQPLLAFHLTRPSNSKLDSRSMPVAASQCNASPNQGLECHRLHPIQFQSNPSSPIQLEASQKRAPLPLAVASNLFSISCQAKLTSKIIYNLHLHHWCFIQDHLNIVMLQCFNAFKEKELQAVGA